MALVEDESESFGVECIKRFVKTKIKDGKDITKVHIASAHKKGGFKGGKAFPLSYLLASVVCPDVFVTLRSERIVDLMASMGKKFIKNFIDILYGFHELYFVDDTYIVDKIWMKKVNCGFSDNRAGFAQLELVSRKEKSKMANWESNNSSCVKYGHSWNLTTADNFRRCDRSGCGAVERFVHGEWTSVSEKQEKKKKTGKNTKFVPGSLF